METASSPTVKRAKIEASSSGATTPGRSGAVSGVACFFGDEDEDEGTPVEDIKSGTTSAKYPCDTTGTAAVPAVACFFNDEDDDENFAEVSKTAKASEAATNTAEPHAAAESKAPEPAKVVEVPQVLEALSKHLCNDTKFAKAVALLIKLMQAELKKENATVFYSAVCKMMCDCATRDVTNKAFKAAYISIFDCIYGNLDKFTSAEKYSLQTYGFYAHTRNMILTDDGFQYAKYVGQIKTSIEASTFDIGGLDEEQVSQWEERQRVLVCCIETALTNYRWNWAKQPCDALVSAASQRRLLFSESVRQQLDELVNMVAIMQRKNASSTGTKTYRAYDSTSHPLRSKRKEFGAV
jgi:hypothetical protein